MGAGKLIAAVTALDPPVGLGAGDVAFFDLEPGTPGNLDTIRSLSQDSVDGLGTATISCPNFLGVHYQYAVFKPANASGYRQSRSLRVSC